MLQRQNGLNRTSLMQKELFVIQKLVLLMSSIC